MLLSHNCYTCHCNYIPKNESYDQFLATLVICLRHTRTQQTSQPPAIPIRYYMPKSYDGTRARMIRSPVALSKQCCQ